MIKQFLVIVIVLSNLYSTVNTNIPNRRVAQFGGEKGYIVIPAPYSIPGIGEGIAWFSSFNNYYKNTDVYIGNVTGDVEGGFLGIWDLNIIDNRLFVNIDYNNMSKVATSNYSTRGLEGNGENYSILEFNKYEQKAIQTTLSFFQRRLEFVLKISNNQTRLNAIKNQDGQTIENIINPTITTTNTNEFKTVFDFTDDKLDPRKGIRAEIGTEYTKPQSTFDSKFYTINYNISAYIPMMKASTLVFNYFKSDAHVTQEGELDKNKIASKLGFNCGNNCAPSLQQLIDNTFYVNKLGNAKPLGGSHRLRSYKTNRFIASHSQSFGTEFRWNLNSSRKPLDLYFMKDVKTGIQFAIFYEIATSTDETSKLWSDTKSTSGIGTRFIMGSGVIYRFDIANGEEGTELSIMVNYPWEGII